MSTLRRPWTSAQEKPTTHAMPRPCMAAQQHASQALWRFEKPTFSKITVE